MDFFYEIYERSSEHDKLEFIFEILSFPGLFKVNSEFIDIYNGNRDAFINNNVIIKEDEIKININDLNKLSTDELIDVFNDDYFKLGKIFYCLDDDILKNPASENIDV